MVKVIKITKLKYMASGAKYCAHIKIDFKQVTGFGKTEKEAITKATEKLTKHLNK